MLHTTQVRIVANESTAMSSSDSSSGSGSSSSPSTATMIDGDQSAQQTPMVPQWAAKIDSELIRYSVHGPFLGHGSWSNVYRGEVTHELPKRDVTTRCGIYVWPREAASHFGLRKDAALKVLTMPCDNPEQDPHVRMMTRVPAHPALVKYLGYSDMPSTDEQRQRVIVMKVAAGVSCPAEFWRGIADNRNCVVDVLSRKLKIAASIASAAAHLHRHGLVHSNITMGNVVVLSTAAAEAHAVLTGAMYSGEIGTSIFTRTPLHVNRETWLHRTTLPPEVRDNEHAVYATSMDVFLMGYFLLELLTNKRVDLLSAVDPVSKKSLTAERFPAVFASGHFLGTKDEFKSALTKLGNRVCDRLWTLIGDCTSADPEQRPTMAAVVDCLNHLAAELDE